MEIFLMLVLILIFAKLGGLLAEKLHQPAVLGEFLVGLAMGPHVLGIIKSSVTMETLSNIGIVVLMFLVGLHINPERFKKLLGKGFWIAFFGVITPLILGMLLGLMSGLSIQTSVFIGSIMTATSVSVTTRVMGRAIKKPAGIAILDAAVMDDIMGIVLFTILIATFSGSGFDITHLALTLLGIAVFFITVFKIGKKIIPPLLDFGIHLNFRVKEGLFSLVLALLLFFAFLAQVVGLSIITGAFLLGLVIPHKKLGNVKHEIYALGYGMVIPIFFVYMGSLLNPLDIINSFPLVVLFLSIAFAGKFLGCYLTSRIFGFNHMESALIGLGMIPRLEVAMIIANTGRTLGFLPASMFTALLTALALTVLISPVFIRMVMKSINYRQ